MRNHRLLELFLVRALGYTWDEVHEEAERLEHAVSDRLIQRIAEYLGNPRYDPHGDPIPGPEGDITRRNLTPLSEWPQGEKGHGGAAARSGPEMLRYLAEKGLVIGAEVEVVKTDPFDGPLTLVVDETRQVIGAHVAQYVLVSAWIASWGHADGDTNRIAAKGESPNSADHPGSDGPFMGAFPSWQQLLSVLDHSRSKNSSTVIPACRIILLNIPVLSSL